MVMMFNKISSRLLIAACLLVLGCSSDENPGYRIFFQPNSDLRLFIPDSLGIANETAAEVHYFADQVPHCFRSDGSPVDIVLAEATIFYNRDYLYPDYFPASLNAIFTTEDYVDYLRREDRFTFRLTPAEYAFHSEIRDGVRALVGVNLNFTGPTVSTDSPLLIEEVYYLYSAWVDGLKVGDSIRAINGTPLEGMDEAGVLDLFPNSEGEKATFTVERGDETIAIQTASEENIGRLLRPDLAYLNARSFTMLTGPEIRQDFLELVDASTGTIDKLILDLRDNGGGSVAGALWLVDYLIDMDDGTNPIWTYNYKEGVPLADYLGDSTEYNIGDFTSSNFVLLVDGYSASSSEITAAALMHYDAVTSMGEQTFGKGVGQLVYELLDGSAVWVTALEAQGPSGESWHETGITPDYLISAAPESFDTDPLMEAAIAFLDTGTVPVDAAVSARRESARQLAGRAPEGLVEKMRDKAKGWR
jgi:C-terminal processing protease CtpA/Prc